MAQRCFFLNFLAECTLVMTTPVFHLVSRQFRLGTAEPFGKTRHLMVLWGSNSKRNSSSGERIHPKLSYRVETKNIWWWSNNTRVLRGRYYTIFWTRISKSGQLAVPRVPRPVAITSKPTPYLSGMRSFSLFRAWPCPHLPSRQL